MRIWLDLVMLLNFLVDGLLLLAADKMCGFPSEPRRVLGAAVLGGVYGGACLLPGFRFLGSTFWRTVSLAMMGALAFGWNRGTVKRCLVFLLLTMALGGLAVSFGRGSTPVLILGALSLWGLCRTAFSGTGVQEYVSVELSFQGRTERFVALRDSGNALRDPITGEQVLVVSGDVACRLTGLTEQQLRNPLETLAQRPIPGLRLIPYHAVGSETGMLLALRLTQARIGREQRSTVVAFAPEGLGRGEMYQALTGGV